MGFVIIAAWVALAVCFAIIGKVLQLDALVAVGGCMLLVLAAVVGVSAW